MAHPGFLPEAGGGISAPAMSAFNRRMAIARMRECGLGGNVVRLIPQLAGSGGRRFAVLTQRSKPNGHQCYTPGWGQLRGPSYA